MNKLVTEVSRKNLVGKTKVQSPARYNKRLRYSTMSIPEIEGDKLLKDDMLVIHVQVGAYTDSIAYEGVCKRIIELVKNSNRHSLTRRIVVRAMNEQVDAGDIYVRCSCMDFKCLPADTEIKLLSGGYATIKDVCERYNNGEKLWVYAVDDKGDFHPGEIINAVCTGKSSTLVEVTLDSGEKITTTADHLYMMRDGTYKAAADLKVDDSLMPLLNIDTYEQCRKLFPKSTKSENLTIPFNEILELFRVDRLNHRVSSVRTISLAEPVDVYDIEVKDFHNFLVKGDVILHNCRFAYQATRYKYIYGDPENRPANITNPNDDIGAVCKHLACILSNKKWLVKAASVVNDYIHDNYESFLKAYNLDADEFRIDEKAYNAAIAGAIKREHDRLPPELFGITSRLYAPEDLEKILFDMLNRRGWELRIDNDLDKPIVVYVSKSLEALDNPEDSTDNIYKFDVMPAGSRVRLQWVKD